MEELEEEKKVMIQKFERENESLLKENEALQKELEELRNQLDYAEKASTNMNKGTKISVSQQKMYLSSVETMRVMFQKYDNEKNETIKLSDVLNLHNDFGEVLSEEEGKQVLADLSEHAKDNKISFDQFLKWWINYKKRDRFKIISVDLKKIGGFKLKNVIRKFVGTMQTRAFRVKYFYNNKETGEQKPISPWHDIPLSPMGESLHKLSKENFLVSFVCEIPKWTRAKYEIATREKLNPIKQDIKYGKLRYYEHGDFYFNYGALPQTFEDPTLISEETGKKGDNDPLDCIEIGTRQMEIGEVSIVKPLGVLGLIDGDETDWKVLSINIDDQLCQQLHNVDDIETFLPGCISAIREYFRIYKICTGSDINNFAFDEMPKGRGFAHKIILETHEAWKKLYEKNSIKSE